MKLQFRTFLEMSMRFPPHMPEVWWKETLKKAKEFEYELENLPSILEKGIELENTQAPNLFRIWSIKFLILY